MSAGAAECPEFVGKAIFPLFTRQSTRSLRFNGPEVALIPQTLNSGVNCFGGNFLKNDKPWFVQFSLTQHRLYSTNWPEEEKLQSDRLETQEGRRRGRFPGTRMDAGSHQAHPFPHHAQATAAVDEPRTSGDGASSLANEREPALYDQAAQISPAGNSRIEGLSRRCRGVVRR